MVILTVTFVFYFEDEGTRVRWLLLRFSRVASCLLDSFQSNTKAHFLQCPRSLIVIFTVDVKFSLLHHFCFF